MLDYKPGQLKCVSDNGGSGSNGVGGTMSNVQLGAGNFIERRIIVSAEALSAFEVDIYSYSALLINKIIS